MYPGRLGRRGARTPNRAPLAQVRLQGLFQHAAALHEQAEIDRFVRHVHARIIRIRPAEPAGDLLGRPRVRQFGGHRVTQGRVRRQATPLGPTAAGPRRRVSRGRPIPAPAPVPLHFSTHGRRGPAHLAADVSQPRAASQAAGNGLPLHQRQREATALARRRRNPARPGHFIPHDMGDPPQRAANGIQ